MLKVSVWDSYCRKSMKQIKEIMQDIRGMPVCPRTGESNLYFEINKYKEEKDFVKITPYGVVCDKNKSKR